MVSGVSTMLNISPVKSRGMRKADIEQEAFRGSGGDPSVLRPPISVTVTGVKQVLRALSSGSQEVSCSGGVEIIASIVF